MKIEKGGKYHYHTRRTEGEYIKNIIVDYIYSNGAVGFREKDQGIHSLVNKKHLKKGWIENGENC